MKPEVFNSCCEEAQGRPGGKTGPNEEDYRPWSQQRREVGRGPR